MRYVTGDGVLKDVKGVFIGLRIDLRLFTSRLRVLLGDIMTEWKYARKKPLKIRYREVEPKELIGFDCDVPCEAIYTREGVILGYPDEDFIIEGIEGELYPIKKDIFYKTYDVLEG